MEEMGWHRQLFLAELHIVAEMRHRLLDAQAAIEIGAANMHAAAPQDIRCAVGLACPLG
jgi:hypothetical protein